VIDLSPYQGRWVAISDAEVIAVDDTADGAYYSALDRDPGESFYLNFVEGEVGKKLPFTSLLEEVRPFFLSGEECPFILSAVQFVMPF